MFGLLVREEGRVGGSGRNVPLHVAAIILPENGGVKAAATAGKPAR
jgi:hypothetical protein